MNCQADRPNLFIVGAAKAGTTALHAALAGHAQVGMSSLKEPHYFSSVKVASGYRHLMRRVDSASEYRSLFPYGSEYQWLGEASPSYLWDALAPARIKEYSPNARIVISLRHPVSRAYSHYLMDVREGKQSLPFKDAIVADDSIVERTWGGACHLYADLGHYLKPVKRFIETFGPESVLVLQSSHLHGPGAPGWAALQRFLRLSSPLSFDPATESHNSYARLRYSRLASFTGNATLRTWTQKILPVSLRQRARKVLYDGAAVKPALDDGDAMWLWERYKEEMVALSGFLGSDLSSLTAAPAVTNAPSAGTND